MASARRPREALTRRVKRHPLCAASAAGHAPRVFFAWAGVRMAGRVLDSGDAYVETQCAHVMGLPLAPLRSFLVIDPATGAAVALDDVHDTSVIAAFTRGWGSALTAASAFSLWAEVGSMPLHAALAALGVAALVVGWRTGRLDADAQRRMAHYAAHTRHAVDPRLLPETTRRSLRDALHAEVVDHAIAHAGAGYRDAGQSPHDAWDAIARRPEVRDTAFVGSALTLARLESSLAEDETTRARYDAAHDALWQKLRDEAPSGAVATREQPAAETQRRAARRR
jgi:hypothetical protein